MFYQRGADNFYLFPQTVKKMRKFLHLTLFVNLLTLFVNCSTKYVPVEVVKLDSIRYVDVGRDSIHVLDSVIIASKADTVYLTRWRIEYREALRVDTFIDFKDELCLSSVVNSYSGPGGYTIFVEE